MTALSQGRSVSAAYERTQRPLQGVVSNRGKYMVPMGTAYGSFPLAFSGLLQYCVIYRRLMPGTSDAEQVKQLAADSQQNNASPVFRLYVKGANITVRLSKKESEDVKCKVKDILTGGYGGHLFRFYGCISINGRALVC